MSATEAFNHPQGRVELTVRAMQSAVCELYRMRLANATADTILSMEAQLLSSLGTLHALVEDVRLSNDKRDAEARHQHGRLARQGCRSMD